MITMKMMTTITKSISLIAIFMFASTVAIQELEATPFPDDLDLFLEILFEKTECEDFLSDDKWSTVALRKCKPYTCHFPHELCRRPAARYQDEASNTCVKIPDDCLIAANGGKPFTFKSVSSSATTNSAVVELKSTTVASASSTLTGRRSSIRMPPFSVTKGSKKATGNEEVICDMGQPQGRFCGFQIKVAYNRENQRCEQFWFPGCKTAETNRNLFDTIEECEEATHICRGQASFLPFFTTRLPETATPVAVQTSSQPVPLVAPFLATTVMPRPAPVELTTAPTAHRLRPRLRSHEISGEVVHPGAGATAPQPPPAQPVQPYRVINPSSASMIFNLISNGISQFTGIGSSGTGPEGGRGEGGSGNFFSQIPQLIRSLQG